MTAEANPIYDVIGVGFGPANIALAVCAEEEHRPMRLRFFEARSEPGWQSEMMTHRANIQNHPLRDLVTPRNPRSRYSFTNFLFENGLLFRHLNLGIESPLRKEYAQYIAWVANHFSPLVQYGVRVECVHLLETGLWRVETSDGRTHTARSLVLATGRTPYLPQIFQRLQDPRVFHSTGYLSKLEELLRRGEPQSIAIVGASQSAVEIVLDLKRRLPQTRLACYIRNFGFRLKDTSPFMEEAVFPEYGEQYFAFSQAQRRAMDADLRFMNYSSADMDVLRELYLAMYEESIEGETLIELRRNSDILGVESRGERLAIRDREKYGGEVECREHDAVIVATGFRDLGPLERQERIPPLLAPLAAQFRFSETGELDIAFDHRLAPASQATHLPPVFLNGLCEASHGISDAGSLSNLALRVARILTSVAAHLQAPQTGSRTVVEKVAP